MKRKKVYQILAIAAAISITVPSGAMAEAKSVKSAGVCVDSTVAGVNLYSFKETAFGADGEGNTKEGRGREKEETGHTTKKGTEGENEGTTEGGTEGTTEEGTEGTTEEGTEGTTEGGTEGTTEGETEGTTEGGTEGTIEGGTEGTTEGGTEGATEGGAEGATEGGTEGATEGGTEGTTEGGAEETTEDGSEGITEGDSEGSGNLPWDSESETEGEQPKEEDPRMEDGGSDPSKGESEIHSEKPKEPDTEETEEETEENRPTLTNEELIALQKIVIPPSIEESFRFVTVEKDYAVSNVDKLSVYEGKDTGADVVGTLGKGGVCYVLDDRDSSWYYVESGVVRGFVKISELLIGEDADRYVEQHKESNLAVATAEKEPMENTAFTYTKTTVRSTVVGKQYALCTGDGVNVREGRQEDSRVVGTMNSGDLCYVLADANGEWVFVESKDVRGFVKQEFLKTGKSVKKEVLEIGEDTFSTAYENISPKDNKACYYTITSVKKGSISDSIRESLITYALQFVGNSYVWGGTSLTAGADCSGFVQSIYGAYGYNLPRVAQAQSQYGIQIPLSEAKPGDLIFYAKDGEVYHVVISLGEGKTIEAANTTQGIICSEVDTAHAVWATRVISDSDSDKIRQINENASNGVAYTKAKAGDSGMSLGRFKLTAYCSCAACCGQWSGGPTAGGTIPVQGRTVAMAGVPFGTKLVIGGMIYTVEDRGTPYGHVDIYMNSHEDAQNFGVQYADVYLAN